MTDSLKQQVLKRDNYTCQNCGSKDNLHVHHLSGLYGNLRGGVPFYNLPWRNFEQQMVTLCNSCHSKIHNFHPTIDRDCRKYLMELYPDYYLPPNTEFIDLGGV